MVDYQNGLFLVEYFKEVYSINQSINQKRIRVTEVMNVTLLLRDHYYSANK